MKSLLALARLARPTFLAGGVVGGALGTTTAVLERGGFDLRAYLLAQATITSFHLMTQFANDYFDREGDRLTVATDYSGGSKVLQSGDLSPATALAAALVCCGFGVCGVALLFATGLATAALLALAMAGGAWIYSAPPLRLCARGLGELDTTLVVAVLVPLVAFAAQARGLDARALGVTLPGACAIFAMMLAVEFPDHDADARSGKGNLVVRLGPALAGRLGQAVLAATFLVALPLALAAGLPATELVFVALTLPLAAGLGRGFGLGTRASGLAGEGVAGRGVAFFFIVSLFATLAEAALLGTGHASGR